MRVLLVEDAADLGEATQNRLSRSGIACDLARSVAEAQRTGAPGPESSMLKIKGTEVRQALTDLLARRDLDGLGLEVHIEHARPAEYLPDLAQQVGADLVVMGTVAHTGVPGFFIGNTAERILSRLSCSALTVKPSGSH